MTFTRDTTEWQERRQAQKAENLRVLSIPSRSLNKGSYSGQTSGEAVEKDDPVRSETYRRLVAAYPCKHCGVHGYSQAAHPNTGKGAGTKTDDRDCFALCCDRPGVRGCHSQFDQGALFTKAERRVIEPVWAADTRRQIETEGKWPHGLEKLEIA